MGSVAGLSDADRGNIKRYIEAQFVAFEKADGWIFWTWKTESSPEWDFQDLVRNGMIPQPFDAMSEFPPVPVRVCRWESSKANSALQTGTSAVDWSLVDLQCSSIQAISTQLPPLPTQSLHLNGLFNHSRPHQPEPDGLQQYPSVLKRSL